MRKEQRQETGTVSDNEYKGLGSDLQTMATERMVRPWQSQERTREQQGKEKETLHNSVTLLQYRIHSLKFQINKSS